MQNKQLIWRQWPIMNILFIVVALSSLFTYETWKYVSDTNSQYPVEMIEIEWLCRKLICHPHLIWSKSDFCVPQGQNCWCESGLECNSLPPQWDRVHSLEVCWWEPLVLFPHVWPHRGVRAHAGMDWKLKKKKSVLSVLHCWFYCM